jgi:hypothetical protein
LSGEFIAFLDRKGLGRKSMETDKEVVGSLPDDQ